MTATTPIKSIGLFAGIAARDFSAAIGWYTRLMGHPPDFRPLPTMAQWRAGLQLWDEPDHAGHSITTIVVDDIEAERARLEAAGIVLEDTISGDFGKIAQIADPDGNRLTLTQPPEGFSG